MQVFGQTRFIGSGKMRGSSNAATRNCVDFSKHYQELCPGKISENCGRHDLPRLLNSSKSTNCGKKFAWKAKTLINAALISIHGLLKISVDDHMVVLFGLGLFIKELFFVCHIV